MEPLEAEPEAGGPCKTEWSLAALIRRNGGPLSFESFMRAALYNPDHGYYSRHIQNIGADGDFSTSATLHPLLGRAVGRWAVTRKARVRDGVRWHLVEVGGGTGLLAEALLESLGWLQRGGLQYHMVEVSPVLRRIQADRLERFGVSHHDSMTEALRACDGRALIFSNELVDAFPCRRICWDGRGWREIMVDINSDGSLSEVFSPKALPSDLFDCCALRDRDSWEPGQRVEIHPSYREWFLEWRPHWHSGALLLIDYGDLYPKLYFRRPEGTLRAYHRHDTYSGVDIYRRIGRQDLTADVNFSDLIRWGEQAGLRIENYQTQREFLLQTFPRFAANPSTLSEEAAFIMDEEGMGTAFKVLCQNCYPPGQILIP